MKSIKNPVYSTTIFVRGLFGTVRREVVYRGGTYRQEIFVSGWLQPPEVITNHCHSYRRAIRPNAEATREKGFRICLKTL